jgi:hypothetical protein
MGRNGRRKKTSATMAVVRPVIMLAIGAVAAVAMWQALTHDGRGGTTTPSEQLTQHDRQALDRLLRDGR